MGSKQGLELTTPESRRPGSAWRRRFGSLPFFLFGLVGAGEGGVVANAGGGGVSALGEMGCGGSGCWMCQVKDKAGKKQKFQFLRQLSEGG